MWLLFRPIFQFDSLDRNRFYQHALVAMESDIAVYSLPIWSVYDESLWAINSILIRFDNKNQWQSKSTTNCGWLLILTNKRRNVSLICRRILSLLLYLLCCPVISRRQWALWAQHGTLAPIIKRQSVGIQLGAKVFMVPRAASAGRVGRLVPRRDGISSNQKVKRSDRKSWSPAFRPEASAENMSITSMLMAVIKSTTKRNILIAALLIHSEEISFI